MCHQQSDHLNYKEMIPWRCKLQKKQYSENAQFHFTQLPCNQGNEVREVLKNVHICSIDCMYQPSMQNLKEFWTEFVNTAVYLGSQS